MWRDARDKRLKPIDALKIYALKTAPAFEAAAFAGIAWPDRRTTYATPIRQFARNLGVAFQILNDLKDWRGDDNNKLAAGGDVLGGRPTVVAGRWPWKALPGNTGGISWLWPTTQTPAR